jgi:metal-sulfur cluster biosynthetic enzyme
MITDSASVASRDRRKIRLRLRRLINEVIDPCSAVAGAPVGLVDFGLLRGIDLEPTPDGTWKVVVRLTLTEPGCMMGGPFAMRVREKLSAVQLVASVDVRIVSVGLWRETAMSKSYAAKLAGARGLVQLRTSSNRGSSKPQTLASPEE